MPEVRCRPIDRWDGPHTPDSERRRSPFEAGWNRTLRDLERELYHLDASDVVLGLDLLDHEIRRDGWPRANAEPPPPVVLTMQTRVGPLRFQCDRWDSWRGNVRAIGVTLWRLRLVDESGCNRGTEQYQGWSALPPARPAGPAMTVDDAARFLAEHAGEPWTPKHALSDPGGTWRAASKRLHPDRGGDPALFRQATQARELIEASR